MFSYPELAIKSQQFGAWNAIHPPETVFEAFQVKALRHWLRSSAVS